MSHELRHDSDELPNGLRSFAHVDCRARCMQQRVHDATARVQAELPALSDRREARVEADGGGAVVITRAPGQRCCSAVALVLMPRADSNSR